MCLSLWNILEEELEYCGVQSGLFRFNYIIGQYRLVVKNLFGSGLEVVYIEKPVFRQNKSPLV